MGSVGHHRSFVVVDVEGYGNRARTSRHRTAVRDGLYQVLVAAFVDCDLRWDDEAVDDVGDSVMVLLPADTPKGVLVDQLPERLVAALREHNHVHSTEARLRLRMAVHSGEVHYDEHGKTSDEMIFTYRILDTAEAKRALRESTATLVLVASDPFYQAVIRHQPATRPDAYQVATADVKEVHARVWVRLVDGHPIETARQASPTRRPVMSLAELGPIVEVMLRIPGFDTREGRDLVLSDLPFAATIPRHGADRPDTVSIVRTSASYPGGLDGLVEGIRFYAAGSTAMAELDTLLAQRNRGV
jgi:class 3 adenylate cyclase